MVCAVWVEVQVPGCSLGVSCLSRRSSQLVRGCSQRPTRQPPCLTDLLPGAQGPCGHRGAGHVKAERRQGGEALQGRAGPGVVRGAWCVTESSGKGQVEGRAEPAGPGVQLHLRRLRRHGPGGGDGRAGSSRPSARGRRGRKAPCEVLAQSRAMARVSMAASVCGSEGQTPSRAPSVEVGPAFVGAAPRPPVGKDRGTEGGRSGRWRAFCVSPSCGGGSGQAAVLGPGAAFDRVWISLTAAPNPHWLLVVSAVC